MSTVGALKSAIAVSVLTSALSGSSPILNVTDSVTLEPTGNLMYYVNSTTCQFTVIANDIRKKPVDKDLSKERKCLERLDSFAAYEKDWNGNEADPFAPSLIERCKVLVNRLSVVPFVFPAADDSIEFEFSKSDGSKLIFFVYEDRIEGFAVKPDKSKSVIENVTDDILIKEVDGFYV